MLKIAIAEDRALVRRSMTLLIDREEDMKVVMTAANGEELLENLKNTSVDIVLLDLQMPILDGFETARRIRLIWPELRIMVLSLRDDMVALQKAIKIGVHGYFTKNAPPEELIEALRWMDKEGFYFEQSLLRLMKTINTGNAKDHIQYPDITKKEKEVIRLLALGLAAKEVADRLNVSSRTVERHKANLMGKIHAHNFTEVIIYALTHHWIDLDELA